MLLYLSLGVMIHAWGGGAHQESHTKEAGGSGGSRCYPQLHSEVETNTGYKRPRLRTQTDPLTLLTEANLFYSYNGIHFITTGLFFGVLCSGFHDTHLDV